MRAVTTAGERVLVDCPTPWLRRLLIDATGGELAESAAAAEHETVRLQIRPEDQPLLSKLRWTMVGRGAWSSGRAVLIADACSSGFDVLVEPRGDVLWVTAQYQPSLRTRGVNTVLSRRFRLLAAQTLLHYPALWWASVRGRVPLHVSVTATAGSATMIAGPGGVGKSTLLLAGLARGDVATADNICACDSTDAYGLTEPLRVPAVAGRATTTHGRAEQPLPARVDTLRPERIVVLRRATQPRADELSPAEAARAIIAGTYMAGELRRFWPFAATLALGTGIGPAHPDVTGVAAQLAARLPGLAVSVPRGAPLPINVAPRPAGAR